MNIDHLLEQYFEGNTTAGEEAAIRRFFTTGDVPDNLRMYVPLFACFDDGIKQAKPIRQHPVKREADKPGAAPKNSQSIVLWLSGAAACAAILVGSIFVVTLPKRCPSSGNYVMIDGRCYTDAATVHSAALKSLYEISEDGAFFSGDQPSNAMEIVGNQLKDFDFLLDE
jgi:hypothetical protein